MILPLARSGLLFVLTAIAFATLGRAPGAVNLRIRDLETAIAADGKAGRALKERSAWLARSRQA